MKTELRGYNVKEKRDGKWVHIYRHFTPDLKGAKEAIIDIDKNPDADNIKFIPEYNRT